MQTKADIYANKMEAAVQMIKEVCIANDMPALVIICLGAGKRADGMNEMILTGIHNLEDDSPEPLLLAASVLGIPGFDLARQAFPDMEVGDLSKLQVQ